MTFEEIDIWLGILVLIVVEVGGDHATGQHEPVHYNSMDKETPMPATYKAARFFAGSDILLMFPVITLVFI